MSNFFTVTLFAGVLLSGGLSTGLLADQQLPSRVPGSANQILLTPPLPIRADRVAAWPVAVVIINSRPVNEPDSTRADIVLKPPIFAERNSLGAQMRLTCCELFADLLDLEQGVLRTSVPKVAERRRRVG